MTITLIIAGERDVLYQSQNLINYTNEAGMKRYFIAHKSEQSFSARPQTHIYIHICMCVRVFVVTYCTTRSVLSLHQKMIFIVVKLK